MYNFFDATPLADFDLFNGLVSNFQQHIIQERLRIDQFITTTEFDFKKWIKSITGPSKTWPFDRNVFLFQKMTRCVTNRIMGRVKNLLLSWNKNTRVPHREPEATKRITHLTDSRISFSTPFPSFSPVKRYSEPFQFDFQLFRSNNSLFLFTLV